MTSYWTCPKCGRLNPRRWCEHCGHDPAEVPGQGDLFDAEAGQTARDLGIQRADAAANTDWKARAAQLVAFYAQAQPGGFTSDDVMARLEMEGFETHEPRALGAIFQRAARAGAIRKVGYEQSQRPERHRGVVTRWSAGND